MASLTDILPPSSWVVRFSPLIAAGSTVLDVAAGGGRHTRLFLERGCVVVAVDREPRLSDVSTAPAEIITADLEDGSPWPLGNRRFGGIVVTNYLHRPLFPHLLSALAPQGVLIYETFAVGNERFGKPSNPDFLLRHGELLDVVRDRLRVVAYEDLEVGEPKRAMVQRIAAIAA
jgi:SAM-dependent methyltransferase